MLCGLGALVGVDVVAVDGGSGIVDDDGALDARLPAVPYKHTQSQYKDAFKSITSYNTINATL